MEEHRLYKHPVRFPKWTLDSDDEQVKCVRFWWYVMLPNWSLKQNEMNKTAINFSLIIEAHVYDRQ